MIKYLLFFFILNSCVSYHLTKEGGYRVDDPHVFTYNKKKYQKFRSGLIDTSAIYVRVEKKSCFGIDSLQNSPMYTLRFFAHGQVLFSYFTKDKVDLMNNPNIGIPGYFIIDGTKVKIDRFETINGGQTGKYFGRVMDNGDLLFFDQPPEMYYNSFFLLEKFEPDSSKTIWRKIKPQELRHFVPDW